MTSLQITVLGGLRVEQDGRRLGQFHSRKAEALLVYLVCTGREHAREFLAELLWDDLPADRAMANLRVILNSLRKLLGEHLLITRYTAAFNFEAAHRLDRTVFQAELPPLLQKQVLTADGVTQLATVLALYEGDFLTGFHLRDSRGFEEWALLERERLRRLAIEGWRQLLSHHLHGRDYTAGAQAATRLLEIDPLDEEGYRALMNCLARTGRRNAALVQYQTCVRVLAAELDVDPMAETTALYHRILAATRPNYHNLPAPLTPFFGRETELARLSRQLADPNCRLLTLLGPGGSGKTRLATELGRACVGMFLNGIYLVPLAGTTRDDLLAQTIANSLGVPMSGSEDVSAALHDYLRDKELLLILDNVEHLLDQVDLLLSLLRAAPKLKLLTTSRERLNVQVEQAFEVSGLAYPRDPVTHVEAEHSAVALFVERARRRRADFALTAETAPAVQSICRLVDGLPLALELAAARVSDYPPAEIAARIATNLDFLSTTMQDLPPRQRSLRAVFDHAWESLSRSQQTILRRLSVFNDPFNRLAAQTVAAADEAALGQLNEIALLSQSSANTHTLHPLLRQYAGEHLAARPDEHLTAVGAHRCYVAAFLVEHTEQMKGPLQMVAVAAIEAMVDDVRAAWQSAIDGDDDAALADMLEGLYLFYWTKSWLLEGHGAFERAVAHLAARDEPPPVLLLRLRNRLAEFEGWRSHYEAALHLVNNTLSQSHNLGILEEEALALDVRGRVAYWQGNYRAAVTDFEQALLIYRHLEDPYMMASVLNHLANTLCEVDAAYERARRLYDESLELARELGDRFGEARLLVNLGALWHEDGNLTAARQAYQAGLELAREIDYRRVEALALANLGEIARREADFETALALQSTSLNIKRELGHRYDVINSLAKLGAIATDQGDWRQAKRWYDEALHLARNIQAEDLVLHTLTSLARWVAATHDPKLAAQLLHQVRTYPGGSVELRAAAQQTLDELAAQLPPETATQPRAAAETAPNLEALVDAALALRAPA